jgi:hypothetical protein
VTVSYVTYVWESSVSSYVDTVVSYVDVVTVVYETEYVPAVSVITIAETV